MPEKLKCVGKRTVILGSRVRPILVTGYPNEACHYSTIQLVSYDFHISSDGLVDAIALRGELGEQVFGLH